MLHLMRDFLVKDNSVSDLQRHLQLRFSNLNMIGDDISMIDFIHLLIHVCFSLTSHIPIYKYVLLEINM